MPANASVNPVQSSGILISEIQTGGVDASGAELTKSEFVELYNTSDNAVDLSGWRVDFLTQNHDGLSAPTRIIGNLSGNIEPYGYLILSYKGYLADADFYFDGGPSSGYLAKGSGTIRLINALGQIVDMVGYGTPNNFLGQQAKAPDPGKSLQRCFNDELLVNTNNNAEDFASLAPTTPRDAAACPATTAGPNPGSLPPLGTNPQTSNCQGVVLSELLPNPSGTDAGHEFIEIHNPTTDVISLAGCGLQTSANTKIYKFGAEELSPGQYRAFYDGVSGLVLPNGSGGSVWLLSATNEEIDYVTYPANISDDIAWAWFGQADWGATYAPTPNAANIDQASKPCPAGQERNPATNRCRMLANILNTIAPCGPNKERSPDTNRCRAVAGTDVKPCPTGQERNPDTNRCRKIIAKTLIAGVKDVEAVKQGLSHGWQIAGLILAAGILYGIWEWREDLVYFLRRLRRRQA